MPDQKLAAIVVARLRALLPEDWKGRAGKLFRHGTSAISETMSDAGIPPHEIPTKALSLALDKVEGLAQKDKAAALRDFSEAEERKIDAQLKARSLESRVRREEAEADLAEIDVIKARLEVAAKLKEMGVRVRCDEHGNFIVVSSTDNLDLSEAYDHRLGSGDR